MWKHVSHLFYWKILQNTCRDSYIGADQWIKILIEKTRTSSQMLITYKFHFMQESTKVTFSYEPEQK